MTSPRRRAQVMVTVWACIIAVAAAVVATTTRVDNSVGVWFGAQEPGVAVWRDAMHRFGAREWLLVVLDQRGAASEAADRDRDSLTAAITRLPHAGLVLSDAQVPAAATELSRLLRPAAAPGRRALLVQVTNDLDRQDGYREAFLTAIRESAGTLPTVRGVHVAGAPAINGELNRAARHDVIRFFPLVMLMLALAGGAVFRNIRDTAALLATAMGTVTVTAGALVLAGHPLNMVTVMLPTVLIALSVADSVHLIHAYHRHAGGIGDAISEVWRPSVGTTATTVAGFLAFMGSDVLPIRQLAVFGAFGVGVALLLTFSLTPALLLLLWGTPSARSGHRKRARPSLGLARLQAAPRTVLIGFVLAAALLAGIARLTANTDYAAFFRDGTVVPRDYAAMRAAGFPVNALGVVVQPPSGHGGWSSDSSGVRALADAIARTDGVHTVLSPFTMPGAAGFPALVPAGLLSGDSAAVQLVVLTGATGTRDILALAGAIDTLAGRVLPAGGTATATGTPLLWALMDAGVIRTQRDSLLLVSGACLLLLIWLFRSIPLAVLGLGASLYPVGLVLGLMGLLNIPVNLATVLIAGIAVGIAVDDTIHYIHAWQRERRAGAGRAAAVRSATALVGERLIATSVILVGGFALMGLSDFIPTAQFGLLASLTIVLALAADLLLVPLVLAWGARPA